MKSLFSKKSSKKHNAADEEDPDSDFVVDSQPPSPTKSPTKSSSSRSPSKKFQQQRPDSPLASSPSGRESKSQSQQPQPSQSQPRSSRPFTRHPTDPGQSSRRKKVDPDTHPLNLPPEQRKRFSELSGLSARHSMEHDKEPVVNGGKPSSPPPQPQQPQQQQQQQQPKLSAPTHSNSFTVPITNGTADVKPNGDNDVPAPPPHRSQPSSPTQTAAEDAEKFKNEGNKYFGEKNYSRAIQLYTKGIFILFGTFEILKLASLANSSR